jgi:peptidyl-prolyl cis-trans isomerase SurA
MNKFLSCSIPLVLINFSTLSFANAAELVEKSLAVVNNEVVLLSQLKTLKDRVNKKMIDDLLLFDETPEALLKNQKSQLEFLINEKVMENEIKRQNLSVTMDRVEQEIKDIAKKFNLSRNNLLEEVQKQGMSLAEYQSFLKIKIERQSLVEQEISSKIRILEDDVLAYYGSLGKGGSSSVFEYTLAHIMWKPSSDDSEYLKTASKVLEQLQTGGSFEALAEEYSQDPNFSKGGLLGTFKSGEFSSEIEHAVQDLNIGQNTNLIQTKRGLFIVRVLDKKLVSDPKFEKEKERYKGMLFEKTLKRQFKSWLEQRREESFVRVN